MLLDRIGWTSWSEWSSCNNVGERVRTRKCLNRNPNSNECHGTQREILSCQTPSFNGLFKIDLLNRTVLHALQFFFESNRKFKTGKFFLATHLREDFDTLKQIFKIWYASN